MPVSVRRRPIFWLPCLLLLLACPAGAQMLGMGASGLAHGIPDFGLLDPSAHVVQAGVTEHLTGPLAPFSTIAVHGTLFIDSPVQVTTLLVYADGDLELRADLTIRNTPIDPVHDPEAFGTGLVVLGTFHAAGKPITPFVRSTADILAGADQIAVPVPADWAIGQDVSIPDSRQLTDADVADPHEDVRPNYRLQVQDEVRRIVGLTATGITLDHSLAFAHPSLHLPAVDANGVSTPAQDRFVHLANLSRSITIRSESPTGTRGHALMSQRANVDVSGVAFMDLGRTTSMPIDSTTFDATGAVVRHGTNQLGRYAFHLHHLMGPVNTGQVYQWVFTDNVIRDALKWSFAIHNSHFGLFDSNVVVGSTGSGIVTEDGSETENAISRSFFAGIENRIWTPCPGGTIPGTRLDCDVMGTYDPEIKRGDAIWVRSGQNRISGNVIYSSRSGIAVYTGNAEDGPTAGGGPVNIPKFKGADTTIAANVTPTPNWLRPILQMDGNEIASTSQFGWAWWWTQCDQEPRISDEAFYAGALGLRFSIPACSFPTNTVLWHTYNAAVSTHYADMGFTNTTALNEHGQGIFWVEVNDAGAMGGGHGYGTLDGVIARGFDLAYVHGGQLAPPPVRRLRNALLQTVNGVRLTAFGESSTNLSEPWPDNRFIQTQRFELTNLSCVPMPGSPMKCVELYYDATRPVQQLAGHRREHIILDGYQGNPTARYRLWFDAQAPEKPSTEPLGHTLPDLPTGCNGPLLTNQQDWDQHHCATLMAVAPATTTTKPELVGVLLGPYEAPPAPLPPSEPPPPGPGTPPATGCTNCVSSVLDLDGATWTLGPLFLTNGYALLRNGVDTNGQGLGYVLATDGFVYTSGASGSWYRWEQSFSPPFWNGPGFPEPIPATPNPTPVNCVVSDWGAWSAWMPINATTEQRTRTRTILTSPSNGGLACPALTETETRAIVVPPPVDTTVPVVTLKVSRNGNSANYTVKTTASDNVAVTLFEVRSDGAIVATVPGEITIAIKGKGTHLVTAQASDAAGNMTSKIVTVTR